MWYLQIPSLEGKTTEFLLVPAEQPGGQGSFLCLRTDYDEFMGFSLYQRCGVVIPQQWIPDSLDRTIVAFCDSQPFFPISYSFQTHRKSVS